MAEYKSSNSGLLRPELVKTGDKLIICEPAYTTFNADRQQTYWNAKVQLPGGDYKLAGLFESACDKFAAVWGSDTDQWVGHTINIEIKTAKSGNPYIEMTPGTEDAVKITPEESGSTPVAPATSATGIAYPAEDINPDDIPF